MFSDVQEEFQSSEALFLLALEVEASRLGFALSEVPSSIVKTDHRLKKFEKICDNYIEHYGEPSHELIFQDFMKSCTDLIGLRVVTLYNADLEIVEDKIVHALGLDRKQQVFNDRDLRRGSKFGYRATHWKYVVSDEFVVRQIPHIQITVELQIRSVLSDAWARHSHSLLYKSGEDPSDELIREFGIASAMIEELDNKLDGLIENAGTSERRPYMEDAARTGLGSVLSSIVGGLIPDSDVDSLVTQLAMDNSMSAEVFDELISDAQKAWSKYGGNDFRNMGGGAPYQDLKIALFGIDRTKYACLISPHLRRRTTDFLAAF